MSGSIRLHPKYGVAPALLFCPVCGKDTNGLALLGATADKVMKEHGQDKGYQEYGHNRLPDTNICGECQSILENKGIIIIAEDIQQSLKLNEESITVLKEKIGDIIDFDKIRGQIARVSKAFWYADDEGNIRMRDPKEWLSQ